MTWIHGAWVSVGLALGILHASGIWRSAKQPTATNALLGLARVVFVGLALAASAVFGGILPATAGWVGGYFATVAAVMVSQRRSPQQGTAP